MVQSNEWDFNGNYYVIFIKDLFGNNEHLIRSLLLLFLINQNPLIEFCQIKNIYLTVKKESRNSFLIGKLDEEKILNLLKN